MNLFDCTSWFLAAAFLLVVHVSTGMFSYDFKPSMEALYLPNYDFYHNLSRMNECLRHISAQYSEFVDVEMRYRSRLGLSQYVVHITNFTLEATNKKSTDKRSKVLLSYGEHAGEFFPVQSMFHLLNNITQGYDMFPITYGGNFTRFVLNNFDLYLLTIVNPDGRVFIEKTKKHCWMGTANNIDLNYDLQTDVGNGKTIRIIAEPECKVLRELTSIKQFDALISFHSGHKKIFFPSYAGTRSKASGSSDVYYLASLISSSLPSHYSLIPIKLTGVGNSIFAYAAKDRKIMFTYKISLWENEEKIPGVSDNDCFSTFNPPSMNLQAELEAVHPLYSTLFNYLNYWKEVQLYNKAEQLKKLEDTRRLSFSTVLFFLLGCTGVYLVSRVRVPFSWKMYYRRQRRVVSLRSLGTLFTLVCLV